jgi:AcrR family transcriptional regulator
VSSSKASLRQDVGPMRPKTLLRRKEVLGVVYELIAEHGIDGVTMRQVAQASGLSTGTINYHFKSRHNLVIKALEAAYELPSDWQAYEGSPLAQLRRLASGYIFRTARERFWLFWINYTAQSTRDDEMRRHQNDRYEKQRRFWAELLRAAIAAGEVDRNLDPQEAADDILLTAQALVIRQMQSPTSATREMARKVLDKKFSEFSLKRRRPKPAVSGGGSIQSAKG